MKKETFARQFDIRHTLGLSFSILYGSAFNIHSNASIPTVLSRQTADGLGIQHCQL